MTKEEKLIEYERICGLEKQYADEKKKLQEEIKLEMEPGEVVNCLNKAYKKCVVNKRDVDSETMFAIIENANKHNCIKYKKELNVDTFEDELSNNGFTEEEMISLGNCIIVNTTYSLRPVSKKEIDSPQEEKIPFYFKTLKRA